MAAHRIQALSVAPRPLTWEPALVVHDVYKTYDRRWWWPFSAPNPVLRGASLEIRPGQVVGLVGENGSGKSTLVKIIAGALDRDGGEVIRRGSFGYCPQEPVLFEKLTVAETFKLFGAAYGLAPEKIRSRADALLRDLRFIPYRDTLVQRLSGGTRQKLNLSVALLHEPDLLLLDEPYTGFDYETYQRFWAMSERFAAEGKSLLVVSHLIHEEHRFDAIYEIVNGRIERQTQA